MDLTHLLRPRSIALVGASPRSRRAVTMLRNLREARFPGAVYAVNPNYQEVEGFPCFPGVGSLPQPPDLAVLALGRDRVLPVLEECAAAGGGGAVVYAAGFGEGGGSRDLAAQLAEISRRHAFPVIGPNCVGFLNFLDGAIAYSSPLTRWPHRGHVGAILQSGSVAIGFERTQRYLGYSYLISSGNELSVDAAQLIDFLASDSETRVIAYFSEGIRNPAGFAAGARRARQAGKPIVMLKVGRSPEGAAATVTHTGTLAGDWEIQRAALRRLGVVAVDDLDELLETTHLFAALAGKTAAERVGLVGLSGGEISLNVDLASELGCSFGSLSPATVQALAEVLPSFGRAGNPLDVTGAGIDDLEITRRSLGLVAGDPTLDLTLFGSDHIGSSELSNTMVGFATEAAGATGKPLVYFSNVSAGCQPEVEERLRAAGAVFLQGARETFAAVGHLREWASRQAGELVLPATSPAAARTLDEVESKAILARAGIAVPRSAIATSAGEAAAIADELGYPVVVKVLAADIPHKSSRGGVRLGLRSRSQVEDACQQIGGSRFLVEEMVLDLHTEVIVGLRVDPAWGPAVLVGPGGIRQGKPVLELLPVDHATAEAMVAAAFDGWRAPALVDALLSVASLADSVVEVDVNPLFVSPDGSGAVAVDGLIVEKG